LGLEKLVNFNDGKICLWGIGSRKKAVYETFYEKKPIACVMPCLIRENSISSSTRSVGQVGPVITCPLPDRLADDPVFYLIQRVLGKAHY
jgi:hypothetical protein